VVAGGAVVDRAKNGWSGGRGARRRRAATRAQGREDQSSGRRAGRATVRRARRCGNPMMARARAMFGKRGRASSDASGLSAVAAFLKADEPSDDGADDD